MLDNQLRIFWKQRNLFLFLSPSVSYTHSRARVHTHTLLSSCLIFFSSYLIKKRIILQPLVLRRKTAMSCISLCAAMHQELSLLSRLELYKCYVHKVIYTIGHGSSS